MVPTKTIKNKKTSILINIHTNLTIHNFSRLSPYIYWSYLKYWILLKFNIFEIEMSSTIITTSCLLSTSLSVRFWFIIRNIQFGLHPWLLAQTCYYLCHLLSDKSTGSTFCSNVWSFTLVPDREVLCPLEFPRLKEFLFFFFFFK